MYKEVITMEFNSIEGINIQQKSLPKRALKAQIDKGREDNNKDCPICNG